MRNLQLISQMKCGDKYSHVKFETQKQPCLGSNRFGAISKRIHLMISAFVKSCINLHAIKAYIWDDNSYNGTLFIIFIFIFNRDLKMRGKKQN